METQYDFPKHVDHWSKNSLHIYSPDIAIRRSKFALCMSTELYSIS